MRGADTDFRRLIDKFAKEPGERVSLLTHPTCVAAYDPESLQHSAARELTDRYIADRSGIGLDVFIERHIAEYPALHEWATAIEVAKKLEGK